MGQPDSVSDMHMHVTGSLDGDVCIRCDGIAEVRRYTAWKLPQAAPAIILCRERCYLHLMAQELSCLGAEAVDADCRVWLSVLGIIIRLRWRDRD